jgi:hypothetical protein
MQKPNNDGLPIAGAQVVPVIQLVELKGFILVCWLEDRQE